MFITYVKLALTIIVVFSLAFITYRTKIDALYIPVLSSINSVKYNCYVFLCAKFQRVRSNQQTIDTLIDELNVERAIATSKRRKNRRVIDILGEQIALVKYNSALAEKYFSQEFTYHRFKELLKEIDDIRHENKTSRVLTNRQLAIIYNLIIDHNCSDISQLSRVKLVHILHNIETKSKDARSTSICDAFKSAGKTLYTDKERKAMISDYNKCIEIFEEKDLPHIVEKLKRERKSFEEDLEDKNRSLDKNN